MKSKKLNQQNTDEDTKAAAADWENHEEKTTSDDAGAAKVGDKRRRPAGGDDGKTLKERDESSRLEPERKNPRLMAPSGLLERLIAPSLTPFPLSSLGLGLGLGPGIGPGGGIDAPPGAMLAALLRSFTPTTNPTASDCHGRGGKGGGEEEEERVGGGGEEAHRADAQHAKISASTTPAPTKYDTGDAGELGNSSSCSTSSEALLQQFGSSVTTPSLANLAARFATTPSRHFTQPYAGLVGGAHNLHFDALWANQLHELMQLELLRARIGGGGGGVAASFPFAGDAMNLLAQPSLGQPSLGHGVINPHHLMGQLAQLQNMETLSRIMSGNHAMSRSAANEAATAAAAAAGVSQRRKATAKAEQEQEAPSSKDEKTIMADGVLEQQTGK